MLASLERVKNIAWSISCNGGTVSFLSDPAFLTDDRPATVARFIWPTHPTAPTLSIVTIEGVWTTPAPSRLMGLKNVVGLLTGATINFSLRRTGSVTFDEPIGDVVLETLANGTSDVWARLDTDLYEYDGVRIQILADHSLFPISVSPGDVVEIGEVWLGTNEIINIAQGWSVVEEDTTVFRDTENSQPSNVVGTVRKIMNFTPGPPKTRDEIYGVHGGVGVPQDARASYEGLLYRLSQGRPVVFFPRYDDPEGAPETERTAMARSAIMGTCRKIGGYSHISGDYFAPQPMVLREYPTPF